MSPDKGGGGFESGEILRPKTTQRHPKVYFLFPSFNSAEIIPPKLRKNSPLWETRNENGMTFNKAEAFITCHKLLYK